MVDTDIYRPRAGETQHTTLGPPNGKLSEQLSSLSGYGAVLFCGAIFGFFYAWSSSAMIGFDSADPRVAIAAMQAVNDSIRNPYFFPSFFLTPVVAAAAAAIHWSFARKVAARLFLASALVYLFGGIVLTAVIHIPLNDDLGELIIPEAASEAQLLWDDYSGQWQVWNWVRTGFGGLALLLSAAGVRVSSRVQR